MVRYVSAYVQYNQAYQKLKRVELGTDSFTPDVIIATIGNRYRVSIFFS